MATQLNAIHAWFKRLAPLAIRHRWLIIAIVLIITAVQVSGLMRTTILNSTDAWLLENDPLCLAKQEFEEIFGNDEYVILLFEAEDVFAQEPLQALRSLTRYLEREVPLVKDVVSLTDVEFVRGSADGIDVGDLVPEDIPHEQDRLQEYRRLALSKKMLADRLVSTDSTSTAIAVELRPYDMTDPDTGEMLPELDQQIAIIDAVRDVTSKPEFEPYTITIAGTPMMLVGEMEWVSHESEQVLGITVLVMMVLLALTFRSVVAVIAPVLTAALVSIWVLGFYGWFDIGLQEMMLILPLLLVLVLAVGYNVHVLSFFQQHFQASGSRREAIAHALEESGWPILFTVITTAIGLLSFLVVPIQAIRFAGITSAALLLFCYPLVVLLTPALLSFGADRNNEQIKSNKTWLEDHLEFLGDLVSHHKAAVAVAFILATALFLIPIPHLDVDTDYTRTMGRAVPYVDAGMYVAENIGSLYAYEVMFDFGEQNAVKQPQRLQAIEKLAEGLEQFPTFKRTTSLIDFIKDLNKTMQEGREEHYRIPDDPSLVSQLLLLYEMSGGTEAEDWVDYEYQRARLQVELGSFTSVDVEKQLHYIREEGAELLPEAEVSISGIAANFARMVNYMVSGQIWSIVIALSVIAVVMMIVFGNIPLGLIGMIPNITPVVVSLGLMSLLDTPLHMLTMMVAPMIIGIAVDDTIHVINHFRREFHLTGSYAEANRRTFRTVGRAILMTSLIICLGFAAFLPSQMLAFQHVGLYTIVAVLTALLADFTVTPALLLWLRPFGEEALVEEG